MSAGGEIIQPAIRSSSTRATVALPSVLAGLMFGLSLVLRSHSLTAGLLLTCTALLATWGIYAYIRSGIADSFISWDGRQLTVREGRRTWRVEPQVGLSAITRRVTVGGGYKNTYLWLLDESLSPVLRIHLALWPRDKLASTLAKVGCSSMPTEPLDVTARQLRRQDRRLISFSVAHLTELSIVATTVGIVLVTALLKGA